jgi:hypothetical protein
LAVDRESMPDTATDAHHMCLSSTTFHTRTHRYRVPYILSQPWFHFGAVQSHCALTTFAAHMIVALGHF